MPGSDDDVVVVIPVAEDPPVEVTAPGESKTTTLTLLEQGPMGPMGPQGPKGDPGDPNFAFYRHVQSVAAKEWHIEHTLQDMRPSVTAVDSVERVVGGVVQYNDDGTITVFFSQPIAGEAYLN